MKRFLIVVDMQKDFVDGSLGTKEAEAIIPLAAEKIRHFEGVVCVTLDTHYDNYLETSEGKKLPVKHCIYGTPGWQLNEQISAALEQKSCIKVQKSTFGSTALPALIQEASGGENFTIELIGLCTDICVVSNALLLKAFFPEAPIAVDPACCAGVTPQLHEAALQTMRSCQIDIL